MALEQRWWQDGTRAGLTYGQRKLAEYASMLEQGRQLDVGPKLYNLHRAQAADGVHECYTFEHLKRACQFLSDRKPPEADQDKSTKDNEMGTTCHWCRQKMDNVQVTCRSCRSHWCAGCLWLRHGESVREVHNHPDWTCPVCRGICNCSAQNCHRSRNGLNPTKMLTDEARDMGYPSVALYLIVPFIQQERRFTEDDLRMAQFDPSLAEQLNAPAVGNNQGNMRLLGAAQQQRQSSRRLTTLENQLRKVTAALPPPPEVRMDDGQGFLDMGNVDASLDSLEQLLNDANLRSSSELFGGAGGALHMPAGAGLAGAWPGAGGGAPALLDGQQQAQHAAGGAAGLGQRAAGPGLPGRVGAGANGGMGGGAMGINLGGGMAAAFGRAIAGGRARPGAAVAQPAAPGPAAGAGAATGAGPGGGRPAAARGVDQPHANVLRGSNDSNPYSAAALAALQGPVAGGFWRCEDLDDLFGAPVQPAAPPVLAAQGGQPQVPGQGHAARDGIGVPADRAAPMAAAGTGGGSITGPKQADQQDAAVSAHDAGLGVRLDQWPAAGQPTAGAAAGRNPGSVADGAPGGVGAAAAPAARGGVKRPAGIQAGTGAGAAAKRGNVAADAGTGAAGYLPAAGPLLPPLNPVIEPPAAAYLAHAPARVHAHARAPLGLTGDNARAAGLGLPPVDFEMDKRRKSLNAGARAPLDGLQQMGHQAGPRPAGHAGARVPAGPLGKRMQRAHDDGADLLADGDELPGSGDRRQQRARLDGGPADGEDGAHPMQVDNDLHSDLGRSGDQGAEQIIIDGVDIVVGPPLTQSDSPVQHARAAASTGRGAVSGAHGSALAPRADAAAQEQARGSVDQAPAGAAAAKAADNEQSDVRRPKANYEELTTAEAVRSALNEACKAVAESSEAKEILVSVLEELECYFDCMEDASTLSSEREEQKRVLREVLLSKWQELKGLIDEQIDTAVVIPSSFDELYGTLQDNWPRCELLNSATALRHVVDLVVLLARHLPFDPDDSASKAAMKSLLSTIFNGDTPFLDLKKCDSEAKAMILDAGQRLLNVTIQRKMGGECWQIVVNGVLSCMQLTAVAVSELGKVVSSPDPLKDLECGCVRMKAVHHSIDGPAIQAQQLERIDAERKCLRVVLQHTLLHIVNKCRELEHCSYLFLNRLSGAAAPLTQLLSPSLLLDKASDLEQRDGSPVFEIRRHALTALTAVIGNVCKFGTTVADANEFTWPALFAFVKDLATQLEKQALRPLELLVALQNTSRAWARTEAPAARGFQSLARLGEVQALKLEAINSKMAPLELLAGKAAQVLFMAYSAQLWAGQLHAHLRPDPQLPPGQVPTLSEGVLSWSEMEQVIHAPYLTALESAVHGDAQHHAYVHMGLSCVLQHMGSRTPELPSFVYVTWLTSLLDIKHSIRNLPQLFQHSLFQRLAQDTAAKAQAADDTAMRVRAAIGDCRCVSGSDMDPMDPANFSAEQLLQLLRTQLPALQSMTAQGRFAVLGLHAAVMRPAAAALLVVAHRVGGGDISWLGRMWQLLEVYKAREAEMASMGIGSPMQLIWQRASVHVLLRLVRAGATGRIQSHVLGEDTAAAMLVQCKDTILGAVNRICMTDAPTAAGSGPGQMGAGLVGAMRTPVGPQPSFAAALRESPITFAQALLRTALACAERAGLPHTWIFPQGNIMSDRDSMLLLQLPLHLLSVATHLPGRRQGTLYDSGGQEGQQLAWDPWEHGRDALLRAAIAKGLADMLKHADDGSLEPLPPPAQSPFAHVRPTVGKRELANRVVWWLLAGPVAQHWVAAEESPASDMLVVVAVNAVRWVGSLLSFPRMQTPEALRWFLPPVLRAAARVLASGQCRPLLLLVLRLLRQLVPILAAAQLLPAPDVHTQQQGMQEDLVMRPGEQASAAAVQQLVSRTLFLAACYGTAAVREAVRKAKGPVQVKVNQLRPVMPPVAMPFGRIAPAHAAVEECHKVQGPSGLAWPFPVTSLPEPQRAARELLGGSYSLHQELVEPLVNPNGPAKLAQPLALHSMELMESLIVHCGPLDGCTWARRVLPVLSLYMDWDNDVCPDIALQHSYNRLVGAEVQRRQEAAAAAAEHGVGQGGAAAAGRDAGAGQAVAAVDVTAALLQDPAPPCSWVRALEMSEGQFLGGFKPLSDSQQLAFRRQLLPQQRQHVLDVLPYSLWGQYIDLVSQAAVSQPRRQLLREYQQLAASAAGLTTEKRQQGLEQFLSLCTVEGVAGLQPQQRKHMLKLERTLWASYMAVMRTPDLWATYQQLGSDPGQQKAFLELSHRKQLLAVAMNAAKQPAQVADLQVGTSVDLLGVVLSITQTEPKPPEEAVMWRVRIAGPSSDGQGYFAIPVFLWEVPSQAQQPAIIARRQALQRLKQQDVVGFRGVTVRQSKQGEWGAAEKKGGTPAPLYVQPPGAAAEALRQQSQELLTLGRRLHAPQGSQQGQASRPCGQGRVLAQGAAAAQQAQQPAAHRAPPQEATSQAASNLHFPVVQQRQGPPPQQPDAEPPAAAPPAAAAVKTEVNSSARTVTYE